MVQITTMSCRRTTTSSHLGKKAIERSLERRLSIINAIKFHESFYLKFDGSYGNNGLYSLASGQLADKHLTSSIVTTDQGGIKRDEFRQFIKSRLVEKKVDSLEVFQKRPLKTLYDERI